MKKEMKYIIEKYIDFWIVCLFVFHLFICPVLFIFIIYTDGPYLFMVVQTGTLILWCPLLKIAEDKYGGKKYMEGNDLIKDELMNL